MASPYLRQLDNGCEPQGTAKIFSSPCPFPSQGKSLVKHEAGLGGSHPLYPFPGLLHLKPLALHSGALPFESMWLCPRPLH